MKDYIHYTIEQFGAATKELKEIIAGIPSLVRHPKTSDVWSIVSVIGYEGTEPKATARTTSILIRIELQDDGTEPYAVVDIEKYNSKEERKNWHSASTCISINRLYPHQFAKIPQLVEWLESCIVPSPGEILNNE